MKKISIVVPVYNEEYFISGTLRSISRIAYPSADHEVIVVCDGCTDGTAAAARRFPSVRVIELRENVGRYAARRIGAEASVYPGILFIDSRTSVDSGILAEIDRSSARAIVGTHIPPEKPGPFELFYNAVRRIVFARYFANKDAQIELTGRNFDFYPKGTNCFYVEKEVLFRAYEDLSAVDMRGASSDDTKLINAIVRRTPVVLHPDVKISYYYRTSFWANLTHLFGYNAESFIDYYLHPSQRYFWLVIVLPLLALLGILVGLLLIPQPWTIKLSALLALDMLLAAALARTLREFLVVLYMLPLCVSTFYCGIMRAIALRGYKALRLQAEAKARATSQRGTGGL